MKRQRTTQFDDDRELYNRLRARSFERQCAGAITRDSDLDADEAEDSYREIADPGKWLGL